MVAFTNSPELVSWGLLVVRMTLGVIFFAHGAQKVFGWFGGYGLKGTAGYFKDALHIPTPLFYVAAFIELFGGIAVTVGLMTRVAALGIAVVMSVAIGTSHWKNGFFMNWGAQGGKGEGFEYNLALLAMALFLFLVGPGHLAVLN